MPHRIKLIDGNSAQAGIDFESISNMEFVYEGNNDIVVTSVIIHQDSEKEATECFEIILAVENNGFTISGTAQVNIEDDDNRKSLTVQMPWLFMVV